MFRTKSIHTEPQFPTLDVRRQVPYAANAMPTRPAKQDVRNLTGLFLGTEIDRIAHAKTPVPPLARGRGMPSKKIRTPTEERRYKKVELLRFKENKRGFSGNPLKRRHLLAATDEYPPFQAYHDQDNVTFWDITRQTSRKFTAANNSGVTHLEYLNPDPEQQIASLYPQAFKTSLTDTVAKDIHQAAEGKKDIVGVIDCYKKICRGNVQALLSLLPPQSTGNNQSNVNPVTGFAVKSYRNPSTAEIMATFPDEDSRPKTVLGTTTRPHVPSPYFFKNYNPPPKTAQGQYRDYNYSPYSEDPIYTAWKYLGRYQNTNSETTKLSGLPGSGQLSKSVSRGRQNTSPRANSPLDPDVINPTLLKDNTSEENPVAPSSTPRKESGKAGQPGEEKQEDIEAITVPRVEEGIESSIDHNTTIADTISVPGAEARAESEAADTARDIQQTNSEKTEEVTESSNNNNMAQSAAGNKLEKMASGSEIIIGVEDEKGEQKPVEIDDTDDHLDDVEVSSNGSLRRKVSITERILKSKNSEEQAAHLTQEAENRKKQLEDLLNEHAQIVHEVNSLEIPDDKENQENQATDPTLL